MLARESFPHSNLDPRFFRRPCGESFAHHLDTGSDESSLASTRFGLMAVASLIFLVCYPRVSFRAKTYGLQNSIHPSNDLLYLDRTL